jgi:hypothetical protein
MDDIEAKKTPAVTTVNDAKNDEAVPGEGSILEAEPEKTYYSKTSVWLMILFSGLAIGSDG